MTAYEEKNSITIKRKVNNYTFYLLTLCISFYD